MEAAAKVKEENNKCWAEKMAVRLAGRFGYDKKNPFKPTFHPEKLEEPLKWKTPRRIPCCFMGVSKTVYSCKSSSQHSTVLSPLRLTFVDRDYDHQHQ